MKTGKRAITKNSKIIDVLTGSEVEFNEGQVIDTSVPNKRVGRCKIEGVEGLFKCKDVKGMSNVQED